LLIEKFDSESPKSSEFIDALSPYPDSSILLPKNCFDRLFYCPVVILLCFCYIFLLLISPPTLLMPLYPMKPLLSEISKSREGVLSIRFKANYSGFKSPPFPIYLFSS
jgi:hypothetical protein